MNCDSPTPIHDKHNINISYLYIKDNSLLSLIYSCLIFDIYLSYIYAGDIQSKSKSILEGYTIFLLDGTG